ncbi:hypothetical protein C2G38_2232608 [Gigaspora rosea]|uniref:Uncharacterized protein n=1 Tax=Gigaspora rosea TaxID=44941 RepID=A0A397TRT6_9GLOM|nr:hypothetical protein C2G38_2232608 [Gigaspora rosea]
MCSILEYFAIDEPTWKGHNAKSQIDDIWTTHNILRKFGKPELEQADEITNSNYKIEMTIQLWEEFTDDLKTRMAKLEEQTIRGVTKIRKREGGRPLIKNNQVINDTALNNMEELDKM